MSLQEGIAVNPIISTQAPIVATGMYEDFPGQWGDIHDNLDQSNKAYDLDNARKTMNKHGENAQKFYKDSKDYTKKVIDHSKDYSKKVYDSSVDYSKKVIDSTKDYYNEKSQKVIDQTNKHIEKGKKVVNNVSRNAKKWLRKDQTEDGTITYEFNPKEQGLEVEPLSIEELENYQQEMDHDQFIKDMNNAKESFGVKDDVIEPSWEHPEGEVSPNPQSIDLDGEVSTNPPSTDLYEKSPELQKLEHIQLKD